MSDCLLFPSPRCMCVWVRYTRSGDRDVWTTSCGGYQCLSKADDIKDHWNIVVVGVGRYRGLSCLSRRLNDWQWGDDAVCCMDHWLGKWPSPQNALSGLRWFFWWAMDDMARSILSKKPTRRAICVVTMIDFSCSIEGRRGCRHGQICGLIVLLSNFLEWEASGGKKRSPTVGFGPQGAPRYVPGFYVCSVALVHPQLRICLLGGVQWQTETNKVNVTQDAGSARSETFKQDLSTNLC